jgi:hypothetical protein
MKQIFSRRLKGTTDLKRSFIFLRIDVNLKDLLKELQQTQH